MSSAAINDCDLADYAWLVGPQAEPWLRVAAESRQPLHALAESLRRDLSPARTHLVMEQTELRQRAAAKFERAERMFFTRVGLEQATDQWIAAHKAARLPPNEPVADLSCGIGGDLLAIAARGPALGVDRDPVTALFAQANGRVWLELVNSSFDVRTDDVTSAPLEEVAAWHIDPDRRAHGRRTTRAEFYEPSADAIARLLERNPHGAIKLAPAAEVPPAWPSDCEREWISRDGECKQLVAWFGKLAPSPGVHRATIVRRGSDSHTLAATPQGEPPIASQLKRYLFEPNVAVQLAGLAGTVAEMFQLEAASPGALYLTGDAPLADPALAAFEIQGAIPFQLKRIKQHLRARRIGRLEIKTRGVPHDPDELRTAFRLAGDEQATLILTRIAGALTAIVCRRV